MPDRATTVRSRHPRLTSGLVVGALVVPLTLTLPVLSAPAVQHRPVTPKVERLALQGIDAGAERRLTPVPPHAAGTTVRSSGGRGRLAVLTAERTVKPFRLLGLTWERDAVPPQAVWVRTRVDRTWSPWEELEPGEDGPDAESAEGTSARAGITPLLVPGADGVQVRVETADGRAPSSLRLELVDPGSSPADGVAPPRAASSASAAAATPPIVTRAQWGADESLRDAPRYTSTVKVGFVHHSASSNSYWQRSGWTSADAAKDIRAIYAYDTLSLGWSDIAYNFLVDMAGRVYEGRAGGVDKPVLGAHTGGFNTDTFAVAALGNLDTARPSSGLVDGIARIMAWKLGLFHRDPLGSSVLTSSGGGTSRYAAGVKVTVPTIAGHRDVGATACPGGYLYPYLPGLRSTVRAYQGAALYDPTASSSLLLTNSGLPLTVVARTPMTQTWRLDVSNADGVVLRTQTGTSSGGLVQAAWDGRDSRGSVVLPGPYRLTLSSGTTASSAPPWTGSVTVASPEPPPVPDLHPVFWQPGVRVINGREWSTTCRLYTLDGAIRCWVWAKASYLVQTSSGWVSEYGYRLVDVTYYDWVRPAWELDPRAVDGTWTQGGVSMKTECVFVGATRTRTCRAYALQDVPLRFISSSGRPYVALVPTWVLSTIVYLAERPAG